MYKVSFIFVNRHKEMKNQFKVSRLQMPIELFFSCKFYLVTASILQKRTIEQLRKLLHRKLTDYEEILSYSGIRFNDPL